MTNSVKALFRETERKGSKTGRLPDYGRGLLRKGTSEKGKSPFHIFLTKIGI